MKLPKPLFDAPSTQGKAKAKRRRKKPRVSEIYNGLFREFSHESRDDDGVDVEPAERPATKDKRFDARWEFARQIAMPGAIVSSNVEGVKERCERLGIEFHAGWEPGEEEEKRRLIANVDIAPEAQDQELPEHARRVLSMGSR